MADFICQRQILLRFAALRRVGARPGNSAQMLLVAFHENRLLRPNLFILRELYDTIIFTKIIYLEERRITV